MVTGVMGRNLQVVLKPIIRHCLEYWGLGHYKATPIYYRFYHKASHGWGCILRSY